MEQSEYPRTENQFFHERTEYHDDKNGESIVGNRVECLRFEGCQFDMQRCHHPLDSNGRHQQATGEVQYSQIGDAEADAAFGTKRQLRPTQRNRTGRNENIANDRGNGKGCCGQQERTVVG